MPVTSFYPVLMSGDVATAAAFYQDVLGFEVTYDGGWYVSLRLDQFELAILEREHTTIPAGFRAPTQGVILNLEVDSVDAVHAALTVDLGLEPVLPLRDEDFGQRHFIVEAPDGVLLDVIQPIPPTAEYADAYVAGSEPTDPNEPASAATPPTPGTPVPTTPTPDTPAEPNPAGVH